MKRLIISFVFLFLLIAFSGCYTVPQYFADNNECEEVIVYYPVPVPLPPPIAPPISPIIRPPFVPRPPVIVPDPKPIIRQPEEPRNSGGSGSQIRDPLRDHGGRGNEERNTQGRK